MAVRTLKANFVINTIGAVIPLAVALITVPIYINHIGAARYGVLSIVWVLLGYFGFLDLGLSRAAANALARLRDAPQAARAQVLVTTLILNLGLGLFGSFCLAILGSYLLQHILAVPDSLKPEITQAFPWIVALFPLALISGVGIGALESREKFLLANLLQVSGMSIGQIAPVILAVLWSPSLAIVIPAAAIARAVTVVGILIIVYFDERPLSIGSFDAMQAKRLLSYGGWVTVSSAIIPILVSLDQFVVGAVLGVASVANYAIPMNLVSRSQVFPAALSRTLFPRMSVSARDEASQIAERGIVAVSYGYAAIIAPSVIMAPSFFSYWISPSFSATASPISIILFFGAWVNALAFLPYQLVQSQGRPDKTGKIHLLQIIPYIACMYMLTYRFGLAGAALAWVLRAVVDTILMTYVSSLGRHVFQRTAGALCIVGTSCLISAIYPQKLSSALIIALTLFLLSFAVCLLISKDFRILTKRAVSMIPIIGAMVQQD